MVHLRIEFTISLQINGVRVIDRVFFDIIYTDPIDPIDLLKILREAGVKLAVVNNSVTEHFKHLKGVHPRGWPPGKTYDDVGGTFSSKTKTAVISTSGKLKTGSIDRALHEIGHALDFAKGRPSRQKEFMDAYTKDFNKLTKYEQQPGNAGLSEAFAESFANVYSGARGFATSHPNLDSYWR